MVLNNAIFDIIYWEIHDIDFEESDILFWLNEYENVKDQLFAEWLIDIGLLYDPNELENWEKKEIKKLREHLGVY